MMLRIKSGRPEHLTANALACTAILIIAQREGTPLIGMVCAAACALVEIMATPDVDLAENRKKQRREHWLWEWYRVSYWGPFGLRVAHRSRWSHSLALGLPLRLIYGFWWAAVPVVMLWQQGVISWEEVWFWGQVVAIGAAASDATHYAMDTINPVRWLIG